MNADRPLLGISLMLAFCLLAPIGDAIAKVLGTTVPLAEVILIRFAVQMIVLLPIVYLARCKWRMSGRVLVLTLLRTLLHVMGIATMFTALTYLPLADAVAIAFVMPFILLTLGKFVLDEQIGARRLWACLAGFVGTLLIIQPSFLTVGWPALLPVLVAVIFALFMLITRQIAKETDPVGLQALSGVIAVLMVSPFLILGQFIDAAPLQLVLPTKGQWALLLGIGIVGTSAHLLMTWALRFAPSATLAPLQYLELPFAAIIGFLVFQEFPSALAAIGITITIAAGLYVIQRERAIARSLDGQAG